MVFSETIHIILLHPLPNATPPIDEINLFSAKLVKLLINWAMFQILNFLRNYDIVYLMTGSSPALTVWDR